MRWTWWDTFGSAVIVIGVGALMFDDPKMILVVAFIILMAGGIG